MTSRTIACTLSLLLLLTERAAASSIVIAFSPDGQVHSLYTEPNVPFTAYVFFETWGGGLGPGMTGAEFRLQDFDPAWTPIVEPNPAATLVWGNPVAGGCNIAFDSCQLDCGLLYTIRCIPVSAVSERELAALHHLTPSNPNFTCPVLTACDAPSYTYLCVSSVGACLNPGSETTCNNYFACASSTAVVPTTWSHVKQLYSESR